MCGCWGVYSPFVVGDPSRPTIGTGGGGGVFWATVRTKFQLKSCLKAERLERSCSGKITLVHAAGHRFAPRVWQVVCDVSLFFRVLIYPPSIVALRLEGSAIQFSRNKERVLLPGIMRKPNNSHTLEIKIEYIMSYQPSRTHEVEIVVR